MHIIPIENMTKLHILFNHPSYDISYIKVFHLKLGVEESCLFPLHRTTLFFIPDPNVLIINWGVINHLLSISKFNLIYHFSFNNCKRYISPLMVIIVTTLQNYPLKNKNENSYTDRPYFFQSRSRKQETFCFA